VTDYQEGKNKNPQNKGHLPSKAKASNLATKGSLPETDENRRIVECGVQP